MATPSTSIYKRCIGKHRRAFGRLNIVEFYGLVVELVWLFKAVEKAISLTTVGFLLFSVAEHVRVSGLACMRVNEDARLRLEVINAKVRSQNILC